MKKANLKPCPFCGSEAEYRMGWETLCTRAVRYHQIRCSNSECDIFMDGQSKAGVYRNWNKRAAVRAKNLMAEVEVRK